MNHHLFMAVTAKESPIMTENKMDMMVPRGSKERSKISEGLPVSLPAATPKEKNNTEVRGSMDSRVELKNMVIHQRQIPFQN